MIKAALAGVPVVLTLTAGRAYAQQGSGSQESNEPLTTDPLTGEEVSEDGLFSGFNDPFGGGDSSSSDDPLLGF